ncbi:MAG: ATP-binding cassette domain-containing protein [Planctomycetaceae bacterium]|jgi:ABC-type multidrug transport system ATPase subunit|nr:ATP-binding cassette domain-containing protein [Planctomycetaceae bacterium]
MDYYVKICGKVFGPFNISQVQELIKKGLINKASEISYDRVNWICAWENESIFPKETSVFHSLPKSFVSKNKQQGITFVLRKIQYDVHAGFSLFGQKNITLLRDIDVDIQSGEFVGIIGPSGSGKSTLIRVLNGDYKSSGTLCYNGIVADDFLETQTHKMAYLPQDLILHESLTSREALSYSAKLRSIENPVEMVESVLQQVGMTERADIVIHNLSGGQKKRVALASELLNQPNALFLDEATSGLDPASEYEVMQLFRQLADEGITVICITHFPDNLALCDRLLVVNQGLLAYNGKPQDTLRHFKIMSMNELYGVLQSVKKQKSITQNLLPVSPIAGPPTKNNNTWWYDITNCTTQLPTLLERYLKILIADKKYILFLFFQAPLIAMLIGWTCKIVKEDNFKHAQNWQRVAFLLILSVIWCSSTNGVREIVKESLIYKHERRYRLNAVSYLLSKFLLLGIIGIIQSWVMLIILQATSKFDTDIMIGYLSVTILALFGTVLGLLISSAVKTSEQAITILPIFVIAQAVYSGGVVRLDGVNKIIAFFTAASFWEMEALKVPLSSDLLEVAMLNNEAILGKPYPLISDFLMIIMQIIILLLCAIYFLRSRVNKR